MTIDSPTLNDHALNLATLDLGQKIGKGHPRDLATWCWGLEQVEKRHQQQGDDDPHSDIATKVQSNVLSFCRISAKSLTKR
jgi:hypothetical protein